MNADEAGEPVRVERLVDREAGDVYDSLRYLADPEERSLIVSSGVAVRSRLLRALDDRKLVMAWRGEAGESVVEVDVLPTAAGTRVAVTHHMPEEVPMVAEHALYPRYATEGEGHRCEWCGRAATPIPLYVSSKESDVELGEPVLCDVCAGLVGLVRPHKPVDIDPRGPDEPHREYLQRLLDAEARAAKTTVWTLLAERYDREGRPKPDWMAKPGRLVE